MVREAHELIDGSKPIPVDKLTYELAQHIVLAFDTYECLKTKDVELEVEARIGVLINKEKKRAFFPMYTDAVIEKGFCDFVPGVERKDYEYILKFLHNVNERKFENEKEITETGKFYKGEKKKKTYGKMYSESIDDTYDFIKVETRKSVDKYYTIQENNNRSKKVRVTKYLDSSDEDNNLINNNKKNTTNDNNDNNDNYDTNKNTNKSDNKNNKNNRNKNIRNKDSAMKKTLHKENILTWNVYLGNHYNSQFDSDSYSDSSDNENYSGEKTIANAVDYRVSINLEHKKYISKLCLSKLTPIFERTKERTTFFNKYLGLQFDLTKVYNKEKEIDEIEIEIPSKSILKAMFLLRSKNDYNYLYFICSNLINNVRGICSHLNYLKRNKYGGNVLKNKKNVHSYVHYEHPIEERKRFKKYFNQELPLVGDYMYRCVAVNEKNIRQKLNDFTLSNKEKLNIFKKSVEIRNINHVILKKNIENCAENLWQIVIRDGQKKIVLMSEDNLRKNEHEKEKSEERKTDAESIEDKEQDNTKTEVKEITEKKEVIKDERETLKGDKVKEKQEEQEDRVKEKKKKDGMKEDDHGEAACVNQISDCTKNTIFVNKVSKVENSQEND